MEVDGEKVGGQNGRVGWYDGGWRAEQQGEAWVREQGEFSSAACANCARIRGRATVGNSAEGTF